MIHTQYDDMADVLARRDYDHALRQAFWRHLRHRLGHKCNDLLPTREVLAHLDLQKQCALGIQSVAIKDIVGSSGRYHDFDLTFLPRRRETDGRWLNIARARYEGTALPPATLLKVGDAFFVEDGNHRISVARASGEKEIEALVIEIDSSALVAEPACTRLGFRKMVGKQHQGPMVNAANTD